MSNLTSTAVPSQGEYLPIIIYSSCFVQHIIDVIIILELLADEVHVCNNYCYCACVLFRWSQCSYRMRYLTAKKSTSAKVHNEIYIANTCVNYHIDS